MIMFFLKPSNILEERRLPAIDAKYKADGLKKKLFIEHQDCVTCGATQKQDDSA